MNRRIKQIQSHANLLFDASVPVAGSANTRLDAIVVPAARPASELQHVISMAATLAVPLVILCSKQAQLETGRPPGGEDLRRRGSRHRSPGDLSAAVPDSADLRPRVPPRVRRTVQRPQCQTQHRPAPRPVAGWRKILFVDDDIRGFNPRDVARLAGYLERNPVASMVSRHFPDNSVVCHARRQAGFKQDVFVSGATLGVNLQHPALSFFPDIYNEDWFFFARHAAERTLPKVGDVSQLRVFPVRRSAAGSARGVRRPARRGPVRRLRERAAELRRQPADCEAPEPLAGVQRGPARNDREHAHRTRAGRQMAQPDRVRQHGRVVDHCAQMVGQHLSGPVCELHRELARGREALAADAEQAPFQVERAGRPGRAPASKLAFMWLWPTHRIGDEFRAGRSRLLVVGVLRLGRSPGVRRPGVRSCSCPGPRRAIR